MKWASKSGNHEVQKELAFTEEMCVPQTKLWISRGASWVCDSKGRRGGNSYCPHGLCMVSLWASWVPLCRCLSQSLPNVRWGTQQPLLGTVAPQSYPWQGHRPCLPWPLCSVLSSLLFNTNRQEPAWGHPANSWWACNPSANPGSLPLAPQVAESAFPSLFCSPIFVYRPYTLTGPWAPWRLGLHLSWHPPKVHAWHRAGTQKRRRHEWSGRVSGPHQHQ